jgi:hypothetical protein
MIGGPMAELPQSDTPDEATRGSEPLLQTEKLAEPQEPQPSATVSAALSTELGSEDDRDLIIVEDDPPEPNPPTPTPTPVRRQEYRQLFARLRRG